MKKLKLSILILVTLFLSVAFFSGQKALSYYYDEEEEPAEIYVVKTVSRPREGNEGDLEFKYDLGSDESDRYVRDQIVVFEIKVKNVGDKTINKVTVIDKFPEHVDYPHDDSNWNNDSREYRYEIYDLKVDEESVRQIEGRVTTDSRVCVTNQVWAEPEGADSDYDSAGLCIGKEGKVLGVSVMPETGANLWLSIFSLATAGLGAFLVKKK